jgi:hypothetical protein
MSKITLSNNPVEALHEIASYLRTVRMDKRNAVGEFEKDGNSRDMVAPLQPDHPQLIGYFQLTGWLQGLIDIADECERVGGLLESAANLAKQEHDELAETAKSYLATSLCIEHERDALRSELARIKSASASVPEIEERAGVLDDELIRAAMRMGEAALVKLLRVADSDRATLLDALRALEEQCDQLKVGGNLQEQVNRTIGWERDEARAELAQAQKELERLHSGAWLVVRAREQYPIEAWQFSDDEAQARTFFADVSANWTETFLCRIIAGPGKPQDSIPLHPLQADLTVLRYQYAELERSAVDLREQLAQAERDKAAMREGLLAVKRLVARFAKPPLSDEQLHFCAEALKLLDGVAPPAIIVDCTPDEMRAMLAAMPRDVEAEKGQESKATGEEFRPGYPPLELRMVHREWDDGTEINTFEKVGTLDEYVTAKSWPDGLLLSGLRTLDKVSYRPHGKTWAEVEALAGVKR